MIAVFLAAGRGSRLKSYTDNLPKSLLPLDGQNTILDYNISLLSNLGIDQSIIVTGYKADQISKHVSDYENIQCVYNPFWDKCNVLGSLYMALPFIKDDFLFLHADTMVDKSCWQEMINKQGDIILPYQAKNCGKEEMKVAHDSQGRLKAINKTMNPEDADGEFLGIAKFGGSLKTFIQNTAENLFKKGELNHYMESVIEEAIKTNINIETFNIGDNRFIEIDFEDDYLEARELFG
jgi:choline kinase